MVHITIDMPLTEEQFNACLSVNNFPAHKQMYNEDWTPLFDEEGNQVTEPYTAEEWSEILVKNLIMMPFIRQTTHKLEELNGKFHYDAQAMNEAMMAMMEVTVVI